VQAFEWTNGECVFASGSPFDPVTLANGSTITISQCNNMFIFPGLGLGSTVCGAERITDRTLYDISVALANALTQEELDRGQVCALPLSGEARARLRNPVRDDCASGVPISPANPRRE
jgi:malic enzyme